MLEIQPIAMHIFWSWALFGLLTSAMHIKQTFRDPSEHPFEHLAMHKTSGELYIGAVNKLFKLSSDLTLLETASTGPGVDNPNCPPPLLPCKEEKVMTNSHNQGLAFDYQRNSIIVCFTLYHGICHIRSSENITVVNKQVIKPMVSNHENRSSILLTAPGVNGMALYIASTYSDHGNKRYRDLVPAISSRNLETLEFLHRETGGGTKKAILPHLRATHLVNYVFGFPHNEFVYIITTQKKTPSSTASQYITKIIRLCQKDKLLEAYLEMPLRCRRHRGKVYNLAQAGYLSTADSKLYITFARGEPNTSVATERVAVCVFNLQEIDQTFMENIEDCYKGIGKIGPEYLEASKACEPKKQPINVCGKTKDGIPAHPSIDGKKSVSSVPVVERVGTSFTAVAALTVGNNTVLFLGTEHGTILKILLLSNNHSKTIEELPVDRGQPINSEMYFGYDRKYLYAMSKEKLIMVDIQDCGLKNTCMDCITTGDPFCGWCVMEGRCISQTGCSVSKVSPHWVPAVNGKCLKINIISPKTISLEEMKVNRGIAKMEFEVDTVTFSAKSTDLDCVFSSGTLRKTEKTRASMTNSRVTCLLPSENNLPRIPQDFTNMELEFRVDGKSIVKRNVRLFDCRVHLSCTDCTNSNFSCQWCPLTGNCVAESGNGCADTNNAQTSPQVVVKNITECPRIVNSSTDIMVHSGEMKQVEVQVSNLQKVRKQSMKCWFSFMGEDKSVKAKVSGDNLVCHEMKFHYDDKDNPYFTASFKVTWGKNDLPIDNPENIKVRIYKCSLMVTNCGKCLSMDPNYKCGWCNSKCTLKKHCSKNWLDRSEACPNPQILRFSPTSGPIGGETNVSVTGINLGKKFTDLIGGVKIAGISCQVGPLDYEPSSRFVCKTEVTNKERKGAIEVVVAQKFTAQSNNHFLFVDPQIYSISPRKGPLSGGTKVTLTGSHLSTGSSQEVYLGMSLCNIKWLNATVLECISSVASAEQKSLVTMNFGGSIRTLSDKFSYQEDPKITMVEPTRSIISGGTTVRVKGMNFDLIQKPQFFIKDNETMKISDCKVQSWHLMSCLVPSLDIPAGVNISVNSPKEVYYGFIMEGVQSLRNITDNLQFKPLLYYPDPTVYRFTGKENSKKYIKGDLLVVEGMFRTINPLMSNVMVMVGSDVCRNPAATDTAITCEPPPTPNGIDEKGNALVTLHIGSFRKEVGFLSYYEVQEGETPIALGIILGVVLPMLAIIILLAVCVIRRHRKHAPSEDYIPDVLKDYEGKKEDEEEIGMNHISEKNLGNQEDSSQFISALLSGFEDEQAHQRINELLIPRSKLDIGELLGRGNFGVVYKAHYTHMDNEPPATIAAKSLQGTNTDVKALQLFLKSSLLMREFQHANVLSVIGVCVSASDDPMVVFPFMENGDLRSYIRDSNKSLTVCTLLEYGLQVAEGMAYLAELKFVHQNLAARNCLLSDDRTVKVSDVGLTKELFNKDYYFTVNHTAKLPVKWMAPESLENFVFTSKSDVWSYGVLLWELMTRGVTPYPDVVAWDVHSYVQSGRRMRKPKHCPEYIFQLMLKCWQQEAEERPIFHSVCEEIRRVIQPDSEDVAESDTQPLNVNIEFSGSTEYLEVIE